MFAATAFKGRRVAVFGLARSGLACVEALLMGGADVLAWDDAEASVDKARAGGVPVADLRGADFSGLDSLVLSPGVPLTHPAPHWTVQRAGHAGIEVIGDTEVFARQIAGTGARMVAVTGTNGKSTTTALIGHVLSAAGLDAHVGGNIGKAVFLLPPPAAGRIYVLELSSYQIDLMPSLKPDAGILMNLTPDHLDRHGSMEHYAEVKGRMFARQGPGDCAIVSVDDDWCRAIAEAAAARTEVVRFSVRDTAATVSAPGGVLRDVRDGGTINLNGMRALRGAHNWQNACAAYAAARAMGLSGGQIAAAMASFPGLAHRMEEVGRIGAVAFINDSKATNADAAEKALKSFARVYWIAGGLAKSGGIEPLAPLFGRVAKAYLIGQDAPAFARTLDGKVPYEQCGMLGMAVTAAARDAARDGCGEAVVLFSPACASFDQFSDYEARGAAFRDLVKGLSA